MDRIITQTKIAYFAGFMDGEGSISIASNKPPKQYTRGSIQHYIFIQISNCNYQVLDYLHSIFGGTLTPGGKTSSGKKVFRLTFNSTLAYKILNLIRPHLVAKKDVASLAIEYQEKKSAHKGIRPSLEEMDKRNWYKNKISEINALD